MNAYKFLAEDGTGVFSRFPWPLPAGGTGFLGRFRSGPGDWVEGEVDPCRSGVHACRLMDLPYWIASALYEIELDGDVVTEPIKIVAARGRLLRRVTAWNDKTRDEYSRRCIARAKEIAASGPERLAAWTPADTAAGPALLGFVAARMAEELSGVDAYVEERGRQSAWLADLLDLD
jgi:hypothetical protein